MTPRGKVGLAVSLHANQALKGDTRIALPILDLGLGWGG
jgi:hypothetical protein